MSKLSVIIGMVLGVVLSAFVFGLAFKVAAPTLFFKEIKSTYEFDKTIDILKNKINAQEGWHVTNVIDQQQEIIVNGGKDIGKVKIIQFCNATFSAKMLAADESKFMATKMPLSICVYEKSDGSVTVGLMNGYVMARLFSGTREGAIMENVVKDMENILSFMHVRFTIF